MRERTRTAARLAAVAVVLAATLVPVAEGDLEGLVATCLVCGHAGVAELILNAGLFVPLGLAVARPDGGTRAAAGALGWGLLLSAGVETAQLVVPGRHPALGDLVANAAGAGLGGALAVTLRTWLRPGPIASDLLSLLWGGTAAAVFAATALLLRPSLTDADYWVQRAPDLGHLERFPGEVLDARAGDLLLPEGRLSEADRLRLLERLSRGPRLAARVRLGRPTPGLASVLGVMDGRQREIFLLGQDGRDLVFRLRRRAADARLHAPAHRAAGLVAPTLDGKVMTLGVRPEDQASRKAGGEDPALCLWAGPRQRCGLGHHVGRGWALLLDLDIPASAARPLDAAWIGLLLLPLGLWRRRRAGWRIGLLAALGGLAAAPAWGPLLGAGLAEAVGAGSGLAAGALAGRALRRRDSAGPRSVGGPAPRPDRRQREEKSL